MHTFVCEECQKEFRDYKSEKRQFCSKSCSATATGRGKQKNLGKHWKIKDTSKMKHHRYPFWCVGRKPSIETRKKLSEANKGEKAYQWRGGVSKKYKIGFYSLDYKLWREAVFERDQYICRHCSGSGYVTAHHIKSFAQYPELRFEVDNGLTLCEPCHKQTDNYKGRTRRLS